MTPLRYLVLTLFICAPLLARENPPPSPTSLEEARAWLSNYVAQPRFAAASFGIKVVEASTGDTWFEHNAQALLSPASNAKLYTVAMALDVLGADHRIRTSLYTAGKPSWLGTLSSDLIIYGRGDPGINARLNAGNILEALQPLIHGVTNAGIRKIAGDLVADESYFRGPRYGSGWTWDDLNYYYGAEVSALTIADNTVAVEVSPGKREGEVCTVELKPATRYLRIENRTQTGPTNGTRRIRFERPLNVNEVIVYGTLPLGGSPEKDDLTVSNPAGMFGMFLKEALERHGVRVTGRVRTVNWLDREKEPLDVTKLTEISHRLSRPMGELAREVQKPSQNLYTDLLLAYVGEQFRTNAAGTTFSEDLGLGQLRRFLQAAGVKATDVHFEEGSGLSRNNLTTANATIALLQHMGRHTNSNAFWSALPVAGVDGTLRNRLKGTPAQGKIRAKTGTLRWASSLSGDLVTSGGERLLFCVMLNRYATPNPAQTARAALDDIVLMLVNCGPGSKE